MKPTIYLTSFLLFGANLFSQTSPGKILNPLPGAAVASGDLFIAFQKSPDLRWDGYTIKVYLDDDDLSALSKISGELLTVLALHRLRAGEHVITVRFSAKEKAPLEAVWKFTVPGKSGGGAATQPKSSGAFSLRSDLYLSSRLTDLSGGGQFLRQEPPSLHSLNFRGSAFVNQLEIPFRFFITNQEKGYLQWRNTYMIGLKTKRFGVFIGDVFPNYQRHTLNGSKIRGGSAFVKFGSMTFDATYGAIQRSLEGALRQYDAALGFPPVNLETSTGLFIEAGKYRRDVLSTNLLFESKRSKSRTTLTFLRGTDKVSSIEFGGKAGENLVFGFGHKTATRNQIFQLEVGLASSITTRDKRLGAVSKAEIEDIYDVEPAIDPASVEDIFTMNATTTPFRLNGFPSFAAFANAHLNVLRQHFSLQYERLGGAFYSFGQPYLINDRRSISAGDWAHIWKKRVMLSANYRTYVNNLSEEKPQTQRTGNLQASVRIQPKPELPQVFFSYNDFRRTGKSVPADETVLKRTIQTFTVGANYALKISDLEQGVNLSYSRNNRLDELREDSDFFTDALNVRLNGGLPAGFQVVLEYQFMLLSNDTSDFNRQNGYGFRLQYHSSNQKLRLSAGLRQFRTEETFFTPEANRRLFDGRVEYAIRKDLSLSAQVGRSNYEEAILEGRNFEESWGELGVRWRRR